MIDNLCLINLPKQQLGNLNSLQMESLDQHLKALPGFYLLTCQRLTYCQVLPLEQFNSLMAFLEPIAQNPLTLTGSNAYGFLLETLCGLQSSLVAEQDIVVQFKQAIACFDQNPQRCGPTRQILQKLLQDGKKIRTQYLQTFGGQTYAHVARRLVQSWKQSLPMVGSNQSVLIIGSGQLARELATLLSKRGPVTLLARNHTPMLELTEREQINFLPWDQLPKAAEFDCILNTVGVANLTLFDRNFFHQWKQERQVKGYLPLFIDFGSPSSIELPLEYEKYSPSEAKDELPYLLTLEDLWSLGAKIDHQRSSQIHLAKLAIEQLVEARALWFDQRFDQRSSSSTSAAAV